jgi:alpha-tubulin suppressor-like RCC1 family protein
MRRLTRLLPKILPVLLTAVLISACGSSSTNNSSQVLWGDSAVRSSDGTLRTWGANGFGQLGNSSTTDSHTPVILGNYSSVAIGGGHTAAIKSGGSLYVWGHNSYGQLGNGSTNSSSTPSLLSVDGKTITEVAAGADHTLALASDHTVYSWGYNYYGQLGNGGTTNSSTPIQVSGLPADVTKIAAGAYFSIAIDGSGNVWAWGDNRHGEIGNNNTSTSGVSTPTQVLESDGVTPLSGISEVAAGGSHCLAIDSSGNIWAWGYNYYGQLGDGTTTDRTTAVEVWNTGGAISIAAGLDHSLTVFDNGSVYSCGHNYSGQLGNGDALLSDTPFTTFEPITVTQTNFLSVIAVGNHSIAIDESGHVWTWGANSYGQLGDGTTTTRSTASLIY